MKADFQSTVSSFWSLEFEVVRDSVCSSVFVECWRHRPNIQRRSNGQVVRFSNISRIGRHVI